MASIRSRKVQTTWKCSLKELDQIGKVRRKDVDWAHHVCKVSRAAHLRVWFETLPGDFVSEIIHQLESLAAQMTAIKGTQVYLRNVNIRIRSLNNYLEGKLPVLPPDATDEERKILEQIEKYRRPIREAIASGVEG